MAYYNQNTTNVLPGSYNGLSIQEYIFGKPLGSGSFGRVYEATKFGRKFAIKEIVNINQSAHQELAILQNTKHTNIIQYVDYFRNYLNTRLYIVMEYADQGTLVAHVQNPMWENEQNVWRFFNQMATAFGYLLTKGIIHRDLKPDNILAAIENGQFIFKVADFGIAKLVGNDMQSNHYANTYCGTYCYMAPEVLNRNEYTYSADIWSLGAVMSFVCNTGVHLFRDKGEVKRWMDGKDSLPYSFTINLRQTVANTLCPNPRYRPTAQHLCNTISNNLV